MSAQLHSYDRGSGSPVVFIHGFPLDSTMWRPQLDAFAATHRVLVPDLPGFGQSPRIPRWTMDSIADVLDDWLESVGLRDVALVGLSMGGYIAMAYTRRYAHRLRCLVLVDTKAAPDDDSGKKGRDAMIKLVEQHGSCAIAKAMLPKLFGRNARIHHPELLDEFFEMMCRQSPESVIAALTALRDRPDALPGLKQLQLPTLVVVGDEDELTPLSQAQIMVEAIPGAELAVLPGTGHISNRESPVFNTVLRAFLP